MNLSSLNNIDQSNGKRGIWIDVDFFSKNFQSKQTMRCLLDTGSNWNLIPSEFATTDLIFSEREIPEEVSLVGVSGAKLSGRALSTFTLKIGLILMQTEFFVCNKAMSFPIIGLSFLNLLKAEINCNNNTVKLHSEYAHETISYAPYLQSSFSSSQEQDMVTIKIEPDSETEEGDTSYEEAEPKGEIMETPVALPLRVKGAQNKNFKVWEQACCDLELPSKYCDTLAYVLKEAQDSDYEFYTLDYDSLELNACDLPFQATVKSEIKFFEKLFARHDFDIGKLPDRFSLKFEIRDEKRFYHPGYRMSEPEREILKRLENKFIDQGILKVMDEPSAFRSPSFVIKKPGKSDYNSLKNYRYLTDFRAVNKLSFFVHTNMTRLSYCALQVASESSQIQIQLLVSEGHKVYLVKNLS